MVDLSPTYYEPIGYVQNAQNEEELGNKEKALSELRALIRWSEHRIRMIDK